MYGRVVMVWEPYALAVIFGLVVSAAIYFVVMWPQVEPADDDAEDRAEGGANGDGHGDAPAGELSSPT